jgi:hypothetical protein
MKRQNIILGTIAAIVVSIAIAIIVTPEVRYMKLIKFNARSLYEIGKYENEVLLPVIDRIVDEAHEDLYELTMNSIRFDYSSNLFDSRRDNIMKNVHRDIRDIAEPTAIKLKNAIDNAQEELVEYKSHGVPNRRQEDVRAYEEIIETSIEMLNNLYNMMGMDNTYACKY